MDFLLSAFLGFILVTILDRRWFDIDHKKIEKGYEVIEYYHFGMSTLTKWKGFGVMPKLGCITTEEFPSNTFICISRKLNFDSTTKMRISLKCW